MTGLLLPFASLLAIGAVLGGMLRRRRLELARADARHLSLEEAFSFVEKYGAVSNSFMTLYDGFRYFAYPAEGEPRAMIAYADTGDAWVGGAEPFAPEDDPEPGRHESVREAALAAFATAANRAGRTAFMLPVGTAVARAARARGYRSLQIGSEPAWRFDRFPPTGRTWVDIVPTAKHLDARGARVTELRPDELPAERRAELEEIRIAWLASRGTDPLGFLNQVDPWKHAAKKRFFSVTLGGRTLAFLAAIPIPATKGWYLVDLFRRSDSPAGSTELLLLSAMRLLRQTGAEWASTGIAPLSGLEAASALELADFEEHRTLYKVLRLTYEKGNAFYNFKPLHRYKLKLLPTSCDPAYLIYRRPGGEPRLRLRDALGLFRAFLPSGVLGATRSGFVRLALKFRLSDWIRARLRDDIVVRSAPPSWSRLARRCRLTLALLAINLGFYLWANGLGGELGAGVQQAWEFSWPAFLAHPVHALALSPFLHHGPVHLSLNLLGLTVFTGGLEYLAGSWLTALCYLIPMWLANPLTAGALALAGRAAEADVGASLGIFGTAGGLLLFLRGRGWILGILLGAIALDSISRGSWITWDHAVALALGAAVARARLRG
jgi:lysylphosphatidylglycerol synthetase-like protein (DUF2156 family)/membrane associated rhomboid family serine protease